MTSQAETNGPERRSSNAWSASLYGLLFALVQAAILVFSFLVAPTNWFLFHNAQPVIRSSGYAQRLPAGAHCDVVIVGDSTALAAFLPAVIERRSGLSICNLAETLPIGRFVGADEAIPVYLAPHAPPRFLIAAFTPSNFNLEHRRGLTLGPPEIQFAITYVRQPWVWRMMASHPTSILEWTSEHSRTTPSRSGPSRTSIQSTSISARQPPSSSPPKSATNSPG